MIDVIWSQFPLLTSVQAIADFLLFLSDDKNVFFSSFNGYMSVITRFWSLEVWISEELSVLFESFEYAHPFGELHPPSRYIALALHSLWRPLYEPLQEDSFRQLSLKTVLACAGFCRG